MDSNNVFIGFSPESHLRRRRSFSLSRRTAEGIARLAANQEALMRELRLSRRESILQCMALGSLRVATWLGLTSTISALDAQQSLALKPTQWNEIGPFYKRLAPANPQLRQPNDPGLPVTVSGRIFDTRGEALAGAKIEIWQAVHRGLYDLDGYRYPPTLS